MFAESKLLGQTTQRDAVGDQMVAKASPPYIAFLNPAGQILGILQRQLRALTRAPTVHRVKWVRGEHGIK